MRVEQEPGPRCCVCCLPILAMGSVLASLLGLGLFQLVGWLAG